VQRDTLFSGHAAAERMLQALMSLYVASHYRNTPNDLAMLADAPAHHLFALLGPVDETQVEFNQDLAKRILQTCFQPLLRAAGPRGRDTGGACSF
jgi:N-acetyltransferase 10